MLELCFVDRFNDQLRIFQRRAHSLRSEDDLRFEIFTYMLPET